MRLRPTRGPLVCPRHVSLFCIVFHPILTLEESYLTINVRTTITSSPSCARPPSWCLPIHVYATAHTLRDINHNRKHA